LVIGAIGPWVEATIFLVTLHVNGTEGDGMIVLAATGVAALGLLIWTQHQIAGKWLALLAFPGAAGVAWYDVFNVRDKISDELTSEMVAAQVGGGLWLCCGP
jgi:hypothetical protein